MVERLAGVKGVAGGELRGGRRLRESWGFVLQWFPVEAEGLGGFARSRGTGRWLWMGWGGLACDEMDRRAAAAELAGDGEEGFPPSLAGRGVH